MITKVHIVNVSKALSQRRADSLRGYLIGQVVDPLRVNASGLRESDPVAGNDSAAGRQQNCHVEIIVGNPLFSVR